MPIEIYDTESSNWHKFSGMQRFRHSSWAANDKVYVHGGFESSMPNIPLREINTIDIQKMLTDNDTLLQKTKPSKAKEDKKPKKLDHEFYCPAAQDFHLAQRAHIATSAPKDKHYAEDFTTHVVRQISIDKLAEEPKRMGVIKKDTMVKANKNPFELLCQAFLTPLLKPKEGQDLNVDTPLPFTRAQIKELATQCMRVFEMQPIVIRDIKPPVKIFGDLHGQYCDLMRYFDLWKTPTEAGDIHAHDYLFLGNYVDKG